jgi:SRSO17 transposase
MAAVVENGCAQRFQHFISQSPWDHEPVVAQIARDADALLGGKPDSALIIDESSFPKQGRRSVGPVARDGPDASARSTIVRSRCSAC